MDGVIMEDKNTHYYASNGCKTTINSGLTYYDCPYKLPCGYCKILMRDCVKPNPSYTITCTNSGDDNK